MSVCPKTPNRSQARVHRLKECKASDTVTQTIFDMVIILKNKTQIFRKENFSRTL